MNNDNKNSKNKDGIEEIRAKSEVLNDNKYNVEIAQDFSIPNVSSHIIDVNQPIIGYTAGLITRDLVSQGEKIAAEKYKNKK
ncbi:hypothetical protein KHQ81_02995 [Mycoplasmatota bacterium]|nr:hypothetical protein KHQ81_02995 [Mycoplasmatota bacterium]